MAKQDKKAQKLQSADLAVVAAIAIASGRDPADAVASLVVDHNDPTNLLTKTIERLESQGMAAAQLYTLGELRNKFKNAKRKGTGKGAKALGFGDTKKFKVQVVNGRAFLRVPVDAFDAGQLAVQLQHEAEETGLKGEELAKWKRERIPTMSVSLYEDEEGKHISVSEYTSNEG